MRNVLLLLFSAHETNEGDKMIKKDGLFLFFYRLFASFAIKYVFLISDRMKRLLLLVLWVWVACFTAASHNYMFKHLEVKDGLSNNQVNAIYKDSHGFMWFGTASGLNRYDGYDTRIYRSLKDDGNSLPDSYIEDIQEDATGNLWVRTGAGYAIYNSVSDIFDRNVEGWMWHIGISGNPSTVYIDSEKIFWIYVAGKGIYCYKPGQENAVMVAGTDTLLTEMNITDMTECSEGILLAFGNGVLACLDREKLNVKWTFDGIASQWGKNDNQKLSLCSLTVMNVSGCIALKECGFTICRRKAGRCVLSGAIALTWYGPFRRISMETFGLVETRMELK